MAWKLSAGVYPYEYAKGSGIYRAVNNTIGAAVFASKKGPLGRQLITGGYDEFVRRYGESDLQWSPAHLVLKPALKEMSIFYGYRVVNNAKYAGTSLFYDEVNKKFFSLPFETGSSSDYENASKVSKVISFSDAIPSDKSVRLDLGDTSITQVFNQSSNYTLALLASRIQNALDSKATGGSVKVIKAWTMSDRKQETSITFNRGFMINDVINFTIKGSPNIAEKVITVRYSTSSDATLAAIVASINEMTNISAIILPGDVPAILVTCDNAGPVDMEIESGTALTATLEMNVETVREGHGVYDDRAIVVTLPESLEDMEIDGVIEGSSVTITVEEDAKIMDIFAENPGAWASNETEGLGIKISNLDEGIQQRIRLTLSDAIQVGNSFECIIASGANSWKTAAVAYNTSSDATLAAIADSIQAKLDEVFGEGSVVSVEEVVGGVENDRSIMIVGPKPNTSIEITDATFSGGVSQPIVSIKEIIPNTPSTEQFTLEVYNRESLVNPIEAWKTSFKNQLDANGNQMFIVDKVNKGAYQSENIRVVVHNKDFSKLQNMDSIAWLGGGDDGYLPTTSQIVAGWNEFADPEKVTVRLLINAGYANATVHQTMAAIAKKRHDCVALLDMPSDAQEVNALINYRKYEMNVNTSYAAVYTPDILVFDEVSGTDVYIAPSGYAAAQICFTERTRAIYWAPAGLNRGICDGAKGVRYIYGESERDLIEPLRVNPIRDMGTDGIAIFGEYTTQMADDPLADLHVRLMCNNIEIALTDAYKYKLFDPNDEYSRSAMVLETENYLKPIKDGRGLRDFQVVSDITRENDAEVDAGCAVVEVLLKPTSSLKFIRLNTYVLGSAISFDEVLENGI